MSQSSAINRSLCVAAFAVVAAPWCPVALLRLSAQQHDEGLHERFKTEAPVKWAEYRRRAENLQGKMTMSATIDGRRDAAKKSEYLRNATSRRLLEQSVLPGDSTGTMYVVNPRYSFILKRSAPDAAWLLDSVNTSESGGSTELIGRRLSSPSLAVQVLTSMYAMPLLDVVQKSNFKVRTVRRANVGGQSLVEVRFDYPNVWRKEEDQTYIPIQSGVLWLDPEQFWCVREAELHLKTLVGTGVHTERREFVVKNGSFPIPTRGGSEQNWKLSEGKTMKIQSVSEMDLDVPATLPDDEEFRLSAFGLPEPHGVEWKKPTPTYIWILVAAAAAAVLAVILWLIARRLRGSSAAS